MLGELFCLAVSCRLYVTSERASVEGELSHSDSNTGNCLEIYFEAPQGHKESIEAFLDINVCAIVRFCLLISSLPH